MRIHLAHRLSNRWMSSVELVHESYAAAFGAQVLPDPDSFVTGTALDGAHSGRVVACAGMTFGADRPLFSERYLSEPLEQGIERHFGSMPSRARIVEVGPLASRVPMAGKEIIRVAPIVAWCLGMEYILCTATQALTGTLARLGISFVPFEPARRERLDPADRDRWGTYYDGQPYAGVIPLDYLSQVSAESTARYSFLDMEFSLLADEATHRATRREVSSNARS